jgi:hypothetical protein
LGLAGTPTQVAMPPLTTLAYMGEAREVGGGGAERGLSADIQPAWLARLQPLWRGRRVGQGLGGMTVQLLQHCYAPHPQKGEGEDRCRGWRQEGEERSFHDQG